jgi:ATP-dependent DNA helicase RecQ
VKTSVFSIVLEVVKKFDEKFWTQTIVKFLWWSEDKKLLEWKMDRYNEFWVLWDLKPEVIQAVIEALISLDYLHKTTWQYPLLWLTETGKVAIVKEFLLKNDNKELQSFIKMMLWSKVTRKTKKAEIKEKVSKDNTFDMTLNLIKDGKTLKEIANLRWFTTQTIEDHIVKLYEASKISLVDILKFANFKDVRIIGQVIKTDFNWRIDKLKPIKDKLNELWYPNIKYLDIKFAIAMIYKRDL